LKIPRGAVFADSAAFTITLDTPRILRAQTAADQISIPLAQRPAAQNTLQRTPSLNPPAWQDLLTLSNDPQTATLSGLERESPHVWVKRPWTRANYWEDWMKDDSVAPSGSSARIDQVFVNEEPLQWVPSRVELKPGCFVWRGAAQGGELVICPQADITDLGAAQVEIPVLGNVLGAWEGDPEGLADVRDLRRNQPHVVNVEAGRRFA